MADWKTLADIRRDYGQLGLKESEAMDDPFSQFKKWFEEVLPEEKSDPTAMVLCSADEQGYPDGRVVLLKGIEQESFIFFTNYLSAKAQQLNKNPQAALVFYWPQMARQVRVRGRIKKLSANASDQYFSSRPKASQASAIISPQSQPIDNRDELEAKINQLIEKHGQEPLLRPEYWGGYALVPLEIEFWQGRDSRLHDRILYVKNKNSWVKRRLAP